MPESFLSTIIPCQAGIIAIVITLTLVVVQINSASYPSRIVDYVIKKNPDFWILLTIYLSSIVVGLFSQKTLSLGNAQEYLLLNFSIVIFSYIALVPYFIRTLNLIKSDYVLSELIDELTADDILTENSSFQLISDVLKSAISRNDHSSIETGLIKFTRKVAQINLQLNNKEKRKKIDEIFCKNITITSYNAVDKQNDEIAREFIRILDSYAEYNITNQEVDSFNKCLIGIFGISKNSIDRNLGNAALIGITNLQNLTKRTIECDYDDLTGKILDEYLKEMRKYIYIILTKLDNYSILPGIC